MRKKNDTPYAGVLAGEVHFYPTEKITYAAEKEVNFMNCLERLKMELANRQYLSDEQFRILLEENGLSADIEYKAVNRCALLSTVLDILEILANDIDLFRKVETEFATTSAAHDALSARMLEIKNKIAAIDAESGLRCDSPFSFMYVGR